MRVAIDSTPLLNQRTGIGQYTYHLTRNLLGLSDKLELVLFCTSLRKSISLQELIPKRSNLVYADYRLPARVVQKLWRTIGYPRVESFTGRLDIFHATNYIAPPQKKGKLVLTVHDVGFARMPGEHPRSTRAYTNILLEELDRADRVIVVSSFTKNEVIDVFGIQEEKIQVIYNGVAAHFSQIEDKGAIEQVFKKYGIDGNYILFVGKLEARKNLAGLIEAFRLFKKESKLEHKMVLVGSLGWKAEEILEKLDEYGLQEDVVRLGYVCDEDLPFLMNGADVFLYPSLYEGFGIPVLEAMACGTPVVASNTTSLPEVVGDTGLLVNPTSPGEIAEALTRILVDSALRKTLIMKGLERAASFTWRHAAEQTLRLYKDML